MRGWRGDAGARLAALALLLILPHALPGPAAGLAAERTAAAAALRLCGGAPARMANFHGRRPAARAPPPDLASAVAAIIGMDPAPPAAREGHAGAGRAPGSRGRGRGAGRGRGGAAAAQGRGADAASGRRAAKRAAVTGAAGAWAMHSTDEGSPSKKSKPDAAQLEEPHASAAAASREAERETVPEGEAADSLGSSIEVELPPQHQQPLAVAGRELNEPAPGSGDPWPGAVAALGGSEEAHLRRAEQRRADLEAAMEGAHFGGKELEEATGANVELVQTFGRDEAEEVAGADWPHLLGGGQEAALRERGERVMLEDRMLACSPSQLQGAQRRLLMDSGAHATWGGSGGEKSTARAELVVDGFVQPAQAMVFGTEDGTSADDVRGAAAAERRARWSLVVAHERSYADAMPQDGMGAEGATLSECPGGGGSLLAEEEVVRNAVHSAAEVRLRGVEAEMCRRRALQRLQLLRLRLAQVSPQPCRVHAPNHARVYQDLHTGTHKHAPIQRFKHAPIQRLSLAPGFVGAVLIALLCCVVCLRKRRHDDMRRSGERCRRRRPGSAESGRRRRRACWRRHASCRR